MSEGDLVTARARAKAARAALQETLGDLQERLTPANLAADAMSEIKRRGGALASETADAVSRRPVAVSAAAAGIGALAGALIFWRRHPDPDGDRR